MPHGSRQNTTHKIHIQKYKDKKAEMHDKMRD